MLSPPPVLCPWGNGVDGFLGWKPLGAAKRSTSTWVSMCIWGRLGASAKVTRCQPQTERGQKRAADSPLQHLCLVFLFWGPLSSELELAPAGVLQKTQGPCSEGSDCLPLPFSFFFTNFQKHSHREKVLELKHPPPVQWERQGWKKPGGLLKVETSQKEHTDPSPSAKE